jgi:exoribonuclease R
MPNAQPAPTAIEQAFARAREELGIRSDFSPDALAEAAEAAKRDVASAPGRVDRTAIPFVTVDPPGSRDLDQALYLERDGEGMRVWYAIADVGFFVDRGGALEKEAWSRGVTFYAPDRRDPLYPPVLGTEAASLLPDGLRPAIVFAFRLAGRAEIAWLEVERALVRSRAQLTYEELRDHVEGGGKRFAGKEWAGALELMKELGEKRTEREKERGGVSLPILDQHVERKAAAALGYEIGYDAPNPAEEWNAQLSLLTGHAAALRMVEAKVGLLRVMPPAEPEAVARFRTSALALGFAWPQGMGYADFIHSVDLTQPHVETLLWQARRASRGADYVAFAGDPPPEHLHSALAMLYAHCTAPLRRLADRYVLDLLVQLQSGARPPAQEIETLKALPAVMNGAETKDGKLERKVVDLGEAWTLKGREGESCAADVQGGRGGGVEVQIQDPPVRAEAKKPEGAAHLDLGAHVTVRLVSVDTAEGKAQFEVLGEAAARPAPGS